MNRCVLVIAVTCGLLAGCSPGTPESAAEASPDKVVRVAAGGGDAPDARPANDIAAASAGRWTWRSPDGWTAVSLGRSGSSVMARDARDFPEMVRRLRGMPPSLQRDKWVATIIGYCADKDPGMALPLLKEWTDALPEPWREAAGKVITVLARTDRDAAADFVLNHVPRARQMECWVRVIGELPPADAALWASLFPESRRQVRAVLAIAGQWIRTDPVAAVSWLERQALPEKSVDSEARWLSLKPDWPFTVQLRGEWGHPELRPVRPEDAPPEPVDAAEALGQAWRSARTPWLRRLLADRWLEEAGKAEPERIDEFRAEVADEFHGAGAEAALAEACRDPAGYVAALTAAEEAALTNDAISTLMTTWEQKDVPAAVAWAGRLGRSAVAGQAMQSLNRFDPGAAQAWFATLPPGDFRDQAAAAMARQYANRDPAKAEEWRGKIGNDGLRRRPIL